MKRPYVFCDLHGTLVTRSLNDLALAQIADTVAREPSRVRDAYSTYESSWDLGLIGESDFWRRVFEHPLNVLVNDDLLTECKGAVRTCLTLLPWASDLMNYLDSLGTVVIVSNTKRELVDYLTSRYPRAFGDVIWATSYDLGVRKPSPQFFTRLFLKMGQHLSTTTVSEAVGMLGGSYWIDDDNETLQMARANGFMPVNALTPRVAQRRIEGHEAAAAHVAEVMKMQPRTEIP